VLSYRCLVLGAGVGKRSALRACEAIVQNDSFELLSGAITS
jgi:hypothetical protein